MSDPKKVEGLNRGQMNIMKRFEKQNAERVSSLLKSNRRNTVTGLAITGFVLSVYGYTMFAVKQESILDDLDAPLVGSKAAS